MNLRERFLQILRNHANNFNEQKYWKRHCKFYDDKTPWLLKLYYLYYLRCVEIKHGGHIYRGGKRNPFCGIPVLPHGLNGILIADGCKIGKNCCISHQVTIGKSRGKTPIIGDNVYIGPGAKIFGGIKIGNNVRVGANCVVFEDIPDNATVVLPHPRIIIKPAQYTYFTFKE